MILRDRCRVGPGRGAGQREARAILAARQSRQVMFFLGLGAVMEQQLGGAERVGHGHVRSGHRADRRHFLQHRAMRQGGKLQAAVFLRDDHAEEPVFLQKRPGFLVQVGVRVGDLPLIEHAAQGFDRPVEESLFLEREVGIGLRLQLLPVGFAGEQLAFPSNGTGVERHPFGVRETWKHAQVLF